MSTLIYDFRVIGLDAIDKAFSSVEARVTRHNQTVTRALGGRSVTARAATNPEAAAMRLAQRQERETAKAQQQAERARLREVERSLKAEERLRVQSARESAKKAAAIISASDKELAAKRRERETWRREVGGKVANTIKSSVGGVSKAALAATGLAGGAWLTATTYGAVKQEDAVRRLLINSRGAGQAQLMRPEELQGKIRGASIATGVGEEDITAGLSSFVARTGDLKTGVEMMQTLAQTAAASGASFEDLSGVAADLMTKFDVTKVEDMQDALAGLVFQGKAGAFELRDMADQFPKIGAMAKSMGMGGSEGLKKVGALAQIVRGSTGNAETATFALDAMARQLVMKGGEMGSGKAFGGKAKVNVFKNGDPTQGLRDITEIIPEVLSASNGNLQQLQEIFGGEGMRGMNAFLGTYRQAGGGAAGAAAVRGQISESVNAGGNWAEVQQDAKAAMQSTSAQLEALNTQMKAAVESDLLPALKELIPQLVKLAPAVGDAVKSLAKFVGWAAENPFAGIAAIMSGYITAEMLKVGLSSLLTRLIAASVGGGGALVSGAAGALASGASGVAGMAGIGAAGAGALALGAAGAGAAAGVGLAVWQGNKLYNETNGFSDFGPSHPARTKSGKDYDEWMKQNGIAPGGGPAVDAAASKIADAVASKIAESASGTSAGTLNRGQSPTNPG